jgi:very-short-patch-repair endonuclease
MATPLLTLPRRADDEITDVVFSAAPGTVLALAGATAEQVLSILENADRDREGRLALFVPIRPVASAEQIVDQVTDTLAGTALRMWPVWFTDVDFAGYRGDTLGREAAQIKARQVASETSEVLRPWAEAAVLQVLDGRTPRVSGTPAAIELGQLCRAINRAGLILIIDMDVAQAPATALVHALEWMSRNAGIAVVALFAKLPDNAPPYDRILHGAACVADQQDEFPPVPGELATASERLWLVPVRGIPHPLSETEQRLARALAGDRELAPLFGFNQFVETVRGTRPKVDLLWTAGRLVVELDGYPNHGSHSAFMRDRHRDYELTLTGYTVLRLANDEIAQDIEKAVEKVRDIVRICRARMV